MTILTPPNRLILSQAVEDEYRDVLFRPKFDRIIPAERRSRILDIVLVGTERITPTQAVRDCRDPKDDKYLELALAGGAQAIVSSDSDLLVLHPWRGVSIVAPADFLGLTYLGSP